MATYKTRGVCSSIIEFEVVDGVLHSVSFENGCDGNLTGISRLVEGMKVEEVISKLKGIPCQGNTSCPDQLAKALEEYMAGLTAYESAVEETAVAE
ncbi:MAG: TIGR03905 family TSCPD domain-containing protein [Caldicoprobacterales bacterium]|jgi:uncharacterized protein (TIGR03905 family)|nr:TIGR03905 family TSCPD domain-containing protein [Clostridiales bacterium]